MSWKPNAAATVWTFQIRKGVKFHNGQTLPADDVVKTFKVLTGPSSAAASVTAVSLTAYRTLGHQHLSRVDLIIDSDERPWFLEANVSPGMTETSLLPMAVEAAGMDATEVYAAIVERALTTT